MKILRVNIFGSSRIRRSVCNKEFLLILIVRLFIRLAFYFTIWKEILKTLKSFKLNLTEILYFLLLSFSECILPLNSSIDCVYSLLVRIFRNINQYLLY